MTFDSDLVQRMSEKHELRLPRADESLLAQPALTDVPELTRVNRDQLTRSDINIQGRTLEHLRQWSRRHALQAAGEYTSWLTGEDASLPIDDVDFVYVGGHQPSLFHTGVWVKNFALGALAERTNGVGLNLVIDNDTLSSEHLQVPAGTHERPTIETIAFDRERNPQPWEEIQIIDEPLFSSFGDRVAEAMSHWQIDPLIQEIWPDATDPSLETHLLRDRLTAARARLERRWGLANLELPISRLCALEPFQWFAGHLFANLPRFREVYNGALADYRSQNKIRSRTHPVPDLREQDGWLESPFWVWKAGQSTRGRVFTRQVAREVHLSDGTDVFARLKLSPDMDACCAVEGMQDLPQQGIRLRTRALTTTLFARLCLGDMFVHGIGGAKYDEMTDRIIERFFGLEAPSYLTMSATLHLPLGEPYDVHPIDEVRIQSLIRDLQYNADRHLTSPDAAEANTLVAQKQQLIGEQHAAKTQGLGRRQRRERSRTNFERFRRLQQVNEQLKELSARQGQPLLSELETTRAQLAANSILQNREFSFSLFPAEKLRTFMTDLWPST